MESLFVGMFSKFASPLSIDLVYGVNVLVGVFWCCLLRLG